MGSLVMLPSPCRPVAGGLMGSPAVTPWFPWRNQTNSMKKIIAIDLIDGKAVRLEKGDYQTKKVYRDDPVELARQLEDEGIQYLHLVDLDGAKARHIINHQVLASITSATNLIVDFGGGLKTDEDAKIAFDCGATQITGGSIAVQRPDVFQGWLERYGPERIILGADCRHRMIATQGWLETSELEVTEFITRYAALGVRHVICTDIARDGMLQGISAELYREILKKTDVNLIASGGVAGMRDVELAEQIGCSGVIIGKAFYEGRIELAELVEL